jgi:hypothetical protein
MKPKPLASLNHFTLPVVRMFGTSSFNCVGVPFLRYLSDYCLFAAEMAAFPSPGTKKDLAVSPGPREFTGYVAQTLRFRVLT